MCEEEGGWPMNETNEVLAIVIYTLRVCATSTLISLLIALPIGLLLGFYHNRLTRFLKPIFTAFTGIPPVIAGVVIYLLFSNIGVFGELKWLYTSMAIILAQMIIVIPIIVSQIFPVIEPIRERYILTSIGLGLSKGRMLRQLLSEIPTSIMTAGLSGFGRAIAEVGAVMIVGGNIRFKTRVMTSAIVLETNKGNYDMALQLGLLLVAISLTINFLAMRLSKGVRHDSTT